MKTDLTYLKTMAGGSKELITEMINIFCTQVKEYSEEMTNLLKDKKYDELGRLAHKAKSSVAIMGMKDLADKLKTLELLTKDNAKNAETYPEYVDQFIEECAIASIELKQELSKL